MSEQLCFLLNDDGASYTVSGLIDKSVTHMIIPSEHEGLPVTAIADYAFNREENLVRVEIPASVTRIGHAAFALCRSLEALYLPDSLSSIGGDIVKDFGPKLSRTLYDNAYYLGSKENPFLVLHDTVNTDITACKIHPDCKIVYHDAFSGPHKKAPCKHLKTIVIPRAVEMICGSAFACCERLSSVVFEEDSRLRAIGEHAFFSCLSLTRIALPDSVTSIGTSAFYNCKYLKEIVLPESLTQLDESFHDCQSLRLESFGGALYLGTRENPYFVLVKGEDEPVTECTVHENCKIIAMSAFYAKEALLSVHIPAGVRSVCAAAFRRCKSLREIDLPEGITQLPSNLFAGCENLVSAGLKEGVTLIGENAFDDCRALTDVRLPSTVTAIEKWAFDNCQSLASLTLPDGIKHIDLGAFRGSGLTEISLPEGITVVSDHLCEDCRSLTHVSLPASVTKISYEAFSGCSRLESVSLPPSVTEIGGNAFAECEALRSVTLGDGFARLGQDAFSGCSKLRYNKFDSAFYLGNEENPYLVLIKAAPDTRTCSVHEGCRVIGEYAFARRGSLVRVSIPDGVRVIGAAAFAGCTALRSITLPESVLRLEKYLFANCSQLSLVNLPSGVTEFDENAFYNCESLTSIALPQALTKIESFCFQGCTSLAEIRFSPALTSIGSYAFSKCAALAHLALPTGVARIGCGLLDECQSLVSVSFPHTLTHLGEECCNDCTALQNVYFDGTKEAWEKVGSTWRFGNYRTGKYTLHCKNAIE